MKTFRLEIIQEVINSLLKPTNSRWKSYKEEDFGMIWLINYPRYGNI